MKIRMARLGWRFAAVASLALLGQVRTWSQDAGAADHKVDAIDAAFVMPSEADFDLSTRDQRLEFSRKKKEVNDLRKSVGSAAENVLAGTIDLNTGRADLGRYLNGLVIPEMTAVDNESLFQLADRRESVMKMVQDAPAGSPVRDYLVGEVLLPAMTRIAEDGEYHPAVRLNAVLMVAGLNEREGSRGGAAPQPLPAAEQFLLRLASTDTTPSFLRVAAMSGLIRHAELDGQLLVLSGGGPGAIDDGQRRALMNLGCSLVEAVAETDFAGLSDDQYWLTRQAVQLLGGLARPGDSGQVVACLKKLIENEKTPTLLVADAIAAYGGLQFTDLAQADAGPMAALIGKRLSAMLVADARSIDDYLYQIKEKRMLDQKTTEDTQKSGQGDDAGNDVGASGGGGGLGKKTSSSGPKISANAEIVFPNYQVNDIRQRAKAMTYICRRALDGNAPRRRTDTKPPENLKKFADESTQQSITRLVDVLDRVMDETSLSAKAAGLMPNESLDQKLKAILENSSANIDRVVESLAPKVGA